MLHSITPHRVPSGSAVKAAARRLRRWPKASLDRLHPLAKKGVESFEGFGSSKTLALSDAVFDALHDLAHLHDLPAGHVHCGQARGHCRADRDGW